MPDITKVDQNRVRITKQIIETKTYEELLKRRNHIMDSMAQNEQREATYRAEHQAALDEVNALILEADSLGVGEKEALISIVVDN